MRISKRTRRDAADLCAMMATNRQATLEGTPHIGIGLDEVAESVGASDEVKQFAWRAYIDSESDSDTNTDRYISWWAEADAMIRDGWSG